MDLIASVQEDAATMTRATHTPALSPHAKASKTEASESRAKPQPTPRAERSKGTPRPSAAMARVEPAPAPPPLCGVEERSGRRIRARDCLSGAQRSEFERDPADREHRRAVRRSRTAAAGSPFFGSFLWRSKERDSPAGAKSPPPDPKAAMQRQAAAAQKSRARPSPQPSPRGRGGKTGMQPSNWLRALIQAFSPKQKAARQAAQKELTAPPPAAPATAPPPPRTPDRSPAS
ncbi:hypothetical protein DFQ15_10962 [Xylophilus ampelinus]|uniref:Uncharacterized protein n=1 Tax=Xylophilus ampelinus TaxID=54067 RepID=A0A318SLW4_9BURK|nr:hypothetical protein DFQ15_10962 [Xylophilus ampelinus]